MCAGCGPQGPSEEDAHSAVLTYCQNNRHICTFSGNIEIVAIGKPMTVEIDGGLEVTYWPVKANLVSPGRTRIKEVRVNIRKDPFGEWVPH